jgi:hypothetical protein
VPDRSPLDLEDSSWPFVERWEDDAEAAAQPELFGDFSVSYGDEARDYQELIDGSLDVISNFPGVRRVVHDDGELFLVWGKVDLPALRAALEQWWRARAGSVAIGQSDGDELDETAQRTYTRMLREQIGPPLRQMGFRGSGENYSLVDGECTAHVSFGKDGRRSNRNLVSFIVSLSIDHRPSLEAYYHWKAKTVDVAPSEVRERTQAFLEAERQHGKVGERPDSPPGWGQSLSELMHPRTWPLRVPPMTAFREESEAPGWWEMPAGPQVKPRFGQWELPAGGPIEPLAQTIIDGMKTLGYELPWV